MTSDVLTIARSSAHPDDASAAYYAKVWLIWQFRSLRLLSRDRSLIVAGKRIASVTAAGNTQRRRFSPTEDVIMHTRLIRVVLALFSVLAFASASAFADEYDDTIKVFSNAGESASFFSNSYGYAIFPSIGKGAVGVGGAYGSGRVYEKGKYVGDTTMTQVTVGFQLGGEAYREIIFFQDKKSFDTFTSGNFEFGAQLSAVAITAGASVQASTGGSGASASGTQKHATATSKYRDGIAVFTVARGGLMYEASIGGQKFSYKKK